MMKVVKILFFLVLIVYSVAMLTIELKHGQLHARGFFSDIMVNTDLPLTYKSSFGINTSLSVILLCSCALMFLLCIASSKCRDVKATIFCWSQFAVFLYLAGDERLQFHEWMGVHFGIQDALILLALGGLEVVIFFFFGNVRNQTWKTNSPLFACCIFFGIMTVLDAVLPEEMIGRLALEDLSKLWAIVFLFIYAWRYCKSAIMDEQEIPAAASTP